MNIVDTKQKNLRPLLSFDDGEKIAKQVIQTNHAFFAAPTKNLPFSAGFLSDDYCITGRSDGRYRVQSSILRWSG